MVTLETLSYLSTAPDQFIDITEDVHAAIERSAVTNGLFCRIRPVESW